MEKTYNFKKSDGLIFGIYPGSGVGIEIEDSKGLVKGKPDNAAEIIKALNELYGQRAFMVRGYIQYVGAGEGKHLTPNQVEQYCNSNRKLDLVICYRTDESRMDEWKSFIRKTINDYKKVLVKLQIAEEPNNPDTASGGDGASPNVKQAIIEGVIAAKKEVQKLGLDIEVGFNAVISFDPNDKFWSEMNSLITPDFMQFLDYVGLDFYPGVFRPLPPHVSLSDAVKIVIRHFRADNLHRAGIEIQTPIHITENGWPTNQERTEEQQAEAIEKIIEAVFEIRKECNITHYEFFNLRDANLLSNDWRFGLMREDYSPKLAFDVYKKLIQSLG